MDRGDENSTLVAQYLAAYNSMNIDGMVELLCDDVVFNNIVGDRLTHEARGTTEFREMALSSAGSFSQREQQVLSTRTAGTGDNSRLVVNIRFSAVLSQDLPGVGDRGATIEMDGESEFEFFEGKISRIVDRS